MVHDLNSMVERMSIAALHEMHESLWQLLVARHGDVEESRDLRQCAGAIETELIRRNQAVARYQF